jgi:hypothetical protein
VDAWGGPSAVRRWCGLISWNLAGD